MTVQASDTLLYDGRVWHIRAAPLVPYLEDHPVNFQIKNTSLWRGHVGFWWVHDKRLMLLAIEAKLEDGRVAKVQDVFGDAPLPVFASWFSGELRAGCGDLLEAGYKAQWEVERVLEVKEGVVTRVREELSWSD